VDRSALAEQHLFGLKRVDHGDDQQVAALGRSRRVSADHSALSPCGVFALGHQVAHAHRMSAVEQAQRHA
jgi:hypothetical protein